MYFGVACWVGTAAIAGYPPHPVNIAAAGFAALLPDIDHPSSKVGRWFPAVGKRLTHRGLTHSLVGLAIFAIPILLLYEYQPQWEDIWLALLVGYTSGIVGDILTVAGVQLLWPWRQRFRIPILNKSGGTREKYFNLIMLALAGYLWFSQRSLQEDLQLWLQDAGIVFHWLGNTFIPLVFEGINLLKNLIINQAIALWEWINSFL